MIEVKNENCDYDKTILDCYTDFTVHIVYYKDGGWRLYSIEDIKNQSDYDTAMEEVSGTTGVSKANIKLAKPVSVSFQDFSLEDLLNTKLQKQKAAAKKKIAALKKKFGI